MINVNKLYIVGWRGRVPAETGSRRPYNIINKITIITGNWFPPTSQEYSIYIHTTYIQIIINTIGFPWERVPAETSGSGFPPSDMHMYMGYWTYVRGK